MENNPNPEEIQLSKQWKMTIKDGENGNKIIEIFNPDPENPSVKRFLSVRTDLNEHGQPVFLQEPSLGVDLTKSGNPDLEGKRLVGMVVVEGGRVTDRYSLTNLECMQGGNFSVNLYTGEVIINGESRGSVVCFLDPDKNRLDGLVGVISRGNSVTGSLKDTKVLELQDLAVLACSSLD